MTTTLDAISEDIRGIRLDEAAKALDGVVESDENRAQVWFLRGFLKEMRFDREGALDAYEQSLAVDADYREASFRSGLLCDTLGDDEAAMRHYEQCISGETTHVSALINLAILCEEADRLADAERYLTHVLAEYPNDVRVRKLLKSVQSSYNMVYDERKLREQERRDAILDSPVSEFELSVRSRNCLRQMDIQTLGDLLTTTEAELLSYKNFGETSLNEIRAMLTQKGLSLGQGVTGSEGGDLLGEPPAAVPDAFTQALGTPVSALELSVRSRKCLQRLGVQTLGDLIQHSEAELNATKNFGETSLNEIKRALATQGLSFKSSAP